MWCTRRTLSCSSILKYQWSALSSMATEYMGKNGEQLYKRDVNFTTTKGDSIQLAAVYQDTAPIGSTLGTVVSLHGAPGSHLDFKYITPMLEKRGIRHIGINYPGFDVTESHPKLLCDNFERNGYVTALLDQLNINEKIVLMGHSRGAENALMIAAAKETTGLVLITPFGFRINKGMRPFWWLQTLTRLYQIPGAKPILNPLYYKLYQYVGLKASSGAVAANCLKTIENSGNTELKAPIDKLNQLKTKVLLLYAGKDFLIEPKISVEISAAFEDMHDFKFENLTDGKDQEICSQISEKLHSKKGVSVFFEKDGHFLQKARANVIMAGIDEILGNKTIPVAKL